jgi:hypothetical protein
MFEVIHGEHFRWDIFRLANDVNRPSSLSLDYGAFVHSAIAHISRSETLSSLLAYVVDGLGGSSALRMRTGIVPTLLLPLLQRLTRRTHKLEPRTSDRTAPNSR